MKAIKLIPLLSITLLSLSHAEDKNTITPKKRVSHEDLIQKKKELAKKTAEVVAPDEAPPIVVKKKSLIGSSTLLTNNGQWTLVPKGSVLHIPENLKSKIVTAPSGKLIEWKTFLRKNHGWIHIHTVKMTQAQGKEKVSQDAIKAYKTMGKIVIATCAGGPISIAPDALKPAEKEQ